MSDYDYEPPPDVKPWLDDLRERLKNEDALSLPFGGYILENGKIKKAADILEWAHWFHDYKNRVVESTKFRHNKEEIHVSTVFLGIDHGFSFSGDPRQAILFESMVFGGAIDGFQWRYATMGQAKKGHFEIVAAIKESRMPEINDGEEGFWSFFKEMF